MLKKLSAWFDDRTGYRELVHEALYERVPGGARWRYVWGSTLAFAFVVQLITGIALWMHYSPSTQTAWESVYYIEFQMTGGWLLRGIHHYMAQAMIVLMALHLMQIVIDGAYRAPREINFWLGLILMLLVFGLGLTGYLLPWDQKGYWATRVATTIAGVTPMIGSQLKTIIVGGNEYGHHTLTRFFALHAGVLPGLLIAFMALHIAMFRKCGLTAKEPYQKPDCTFWPDQVLKDAVACLAVLVTVCFLSAMFRAELGAPANAAEAYNAARPEWYYLFLFQFLKFFHGETGELIGAMIIPGLVFGMIAMMPILGQWKLGHRFNLIFLSSLLLGAAGLTIAALNEDYNGETEASKGYLASVELAHAEAERAHELASHGIPPTGMLAMLRNDPKIAGYKLFKRQCGSCHSHVDETLAVTNALETWVPEEGATASNLFGFGNRKWVAGLLDAEQIASDHYFGKTSMTEMSDWVKENIRDAQADLSDEEKKAFVAQVKSAVVALSAEASLPYQAEADAKATEQIAAGRTAIIEGLSCIDCHKFGDEGDLGTAPDLTGYASRQWLIEFMANPATERFYSPDNYFKPESMMPGFAKHLETPELNKLTLRELELIADWLRKDWDDETSNHNDQ